jgi:Ca2+/H+ antiporter, TMEM165/GDT1 family
MNVNKVMFAFLIMLALTLNLGFFIGDFDNPAHHHIYELYAAIVVSLIATVLKFGDRTHIGAVMLAASLVADIQLLVAAMVWGLGVTVLAQPEHLLMPSIVSLAGGAVAANIISVVLLIVETVMVRR